MKFYLGYLLSHSDALIDEIGINRCAVSIADERDAYEVDWEIVQKYGLTYSGATAWFNANYLNKENAPRGMMKYYLLEIYFYPSSDGRVRDTRTILFKSKRKTDELTEEFLFEKFSVEELSECELIEIDLEGLREI